MHLPLERTRAAALRARRMPVAAVIAVVMLATVGCSDDAGTDDRGGERTTTTNDAVEGTDTSTTRPPIDPDDIEGGEEAYVDALVPMLESTSGLDPAAAEAAADCLAPRWVEIIGVEGFAAAGVAPEDITELGGGLETLGLDESTAEEMIGAFASCEIDLRASALAQFTDNPDLTDDVKACIEEAVTLEDVEAGLIANLIGEPPPDGLYAEADACLTEGEQPATGN